MSPVSHGLTQSSSGVHSNGSHDFTFMVIVAELVWVSSVALKLGLLFWRDSRDKTCLRFGISYLASKWRLVLAALWSLRGAFAA